MMPCSFTPFTKNTVTGILLLRMLFKKTSWTLCDFSLAMCFVPYFWGRASPPGSRSLGVRAQALLRINIGLAARKLSLSQIGQKSSAIREIEGRLVARELARRGRCRPHQYRRAARTGCAFKVDIRVAHQPDIRAAREIAEREFYMLDRGLVARGVAGAGQRAEMPGPAEMIGLAPQI